MQAKIFTLYLSTQTPAGSLYAPVDTTNKSIITWNINWEQLYGSILNYDDARIARVKFQLSSLSQASIYTWAANSGVLAIQGLGNKYSNSVNGLVLGAVSPLDNPVAGNPNHIMFGDTLQTPGVQMNMPAGYAPITILILDRTGALQSNILDYQLILQFEMEDE
jgi:hypothetical protein